MHPTSGVLEVVIFYK